MLDVAGRSFKIEVDLDMLDGLRSVPADLAAVTNGVFELRCPEYIHPDGRLEMRHPERSLECRVAYCERQASGGYRLGLVIAGDADRRSETRTAVDLTGVLHMPNSLLNMAVKVVDVSRSGLGLDLPTPIPVGACVRVELSSGIAIGQIRHCAKSLDRYRAGMRTHEFVLHTNTRQILVWDDDKLAIRSAMAALARSVQERQARYEAILFSLAPAIAPNPCVPGSPV
jgi:hypothetical protein